MLWPMSVIWHPVCNEGDETFKKSAEDKNSWIKPIYISDIPKEWDKCYAKINHFINSQEINNEDYYMILNDDDAIEENIIEEIKKMDNDIVVVSMKRGNQTPKERYLYDGREAAPHGSSTLIASPENMKVGGIGPEQIVMKGKIFKTLQYANSYVADGLMAEYIKASTYSIVYRPELFIKFNYFQPGRWNK